MRRTRFNPRVGWSSLSKIAYAVSRRPLEVARIHTFCRISEDRKCHSKVSRVRTANRCRFSCFNSSQKSSKRSSNLEHSSISEVALFLGNSASLTLSQQNNAAETGELIALGRGKDFIVSALCENPR